jgi:hypothetical protein
MISSGSNAITSTSPQTGVTEGHAAGTEDLREDPSHTYQPPAPEGSIYNYTFSIR